MTTISGSGNFYSGSRLLTPVTDVTGLSIDQINFIVCQLVALGLGFPFRTVLDPRTTSAKVRYVVELLLGIVIVLFCFGSQIWHLFVHVTLGYVLMQFTDKPWMPKVVMVVSMGYLAMAHMYRMYVDYGGYTLDITGPLMMTVQRISSVAWSLHDGTKIDDKNLTPGQKKHVIKSVPDVLSYYSYMFSFHSVICGPFSFYDEYVDFIHGTCYKRPGDDSKTIQDIPSPVDCLWRKLIVCVILGALMLSEPFVAPPHVLSDAEWLSNTTFIYRMLYLLVCMTMHRFLYYFAWKLAEVVNNAAGMGFSGYDEQGKAQWNKLNNVEIYNLEVSNSLKLNVDSWNVTTAIWLRHTVYERFPASIGVWAVFTISAFWHGFYPGYYLAFLTGALFTQAARLVRRNVRPYFLQSDGHKYFYDCVTFWFTRFANVYFVCPFVALDFIPVIRFYASIYWWLHILAVGAIVYFTFIAKMINPPKRDRKETKPATETSTEKKEL